MKHTDAEIKAFLEGQGVPWDAFFLSEGVNGSLPAYRNGAGRKFFVIIEDDDLAASVRRFLIREGRVEGKGLEPTRPATQ